MIQGGGEDTLAGVSYPPPSFMFRKTKKIQIKLYQEMKYFHM